MKAYFLSLKSNWETPEEVFRPIASEFSLELDLAASPQNAKLKNFVTKKQNGLTFDISNRRVWCNPPYGKNVTGKWIQKLSTGGAKIAVALVPSRTDTKWFHEFVWKNPHAEIRFIKGRIKFVGAKHAAPFPSMFVIFSHE